MYNCPPMVKMNKVKNKKDKSKILIDDYEQDEESNDFWADKPIEVCPGEIESMNKLWS